jgi:magnesium-protoporphyrin IX monomethyl ester (oxidative) cyclase
MLKSPSKRCSNDSKTELKTPVRIPAENSLLSPKLYTTDFDEIAGMDISLNKPELEAILEEFRADYNRYHFVRDKEFEQSWEHINGETRRLFVEFLERSCVSEFSGFLLYKELGLRLKEKNPVLAEGFTLMSRDEARHAGFLNKALADFNLSINLSSLAKERKYTFFKPKFIFYATYLSEKIGYWRYITIYRHLESQNGNQFYPIFRFFENWCQDENRHGDFFDAVLKSQPHLLNNWRSHLWCRFFLLAVFSVMYLRDVQEPGLYEALGLNARNYAIHVIKKTNETTGRVFPVILDVENPQFFKYLDNCIYNNTKLKLISFSGIPRFFQYFRKLPYYISNGWQFIKLYLMRPVNVERLQGLVR